MIVDNLGLNGLLITEDQDERTFFVTADRSVPPQTRPFHLTHDRRGRAVQPSRDPACEIERRAVLIPALGPEMVAAEVGLRALRTGPVCALRVVYPLTTR